MSYVRVGILGATNGGEVWSINPVFDPTGEFPGSVNQIALDNAAKAIGLIDPGDTMLLGLSSAMSVTGCRLEVRDDVTDDLIAISIQPRTTPRPGGSIPVMGPQNAMVFSLRTDTPGPSGRGRVYWPAAGITIGTNFRLTAVGTAALATEFKVYSNQIRGALATAFPTIGFDLAVRSKTTKTTPHVTKVQIGDIIDTQRRRRDALREAYGTATIP